MCCENIQNDSKEPVLSLASKTYQTNMIKDAINKLEEIRFSDNREWQSVTLNDRFLSQTHK